MKKKIIISIYSHPEHYPPTLNAIDSLSIVYDQIFILYRNFEKNDWTYPKNVKCISSGYLKSVRDVEKSSTLLKIYWFLQFSFNFFSLIVKQQPQTILIYDSIPLLSYRIFKIFIKKKINVWYHNHDVVDINQVSKYSIGWWSAKSEYGAFRWLDIFSLPSVEREKYFPLNSFKGKYFFLPNYPSLKFYSKFWNNLKDEDRIILIYQGSIGEGHGIEEIILLLSKPINNKKLLLYLKGIISKAYKKKIIEICERNGVSESVKFYPFTDYSKVPELASICHIGIAIHTKTDIMNSTLGTSSNKIYEYAALGLPILYFDNEHFKKHLSKYDWAFATDLTTQSLTENIKKIDSNYLDLSTSSISSFKETLNFEYYFLDVIVYLSNLQKLD